MTTVGLSATGVAPATKIGWSRWTGLTGVLFGVIVAVSVTATGGMPDAKNAAKVQAWDLKHTGLLNVSWFATTLAVIIGLYFLTWLHSQLGGREAGWIGNLYLVGMVFFAMAGAVQAGLHATVSTDTKHLSTSSLQLLANLLQNFNWGMTCIGLALMYLGAGYLIRMSGILPGWLAWVSWVFALTALSVILGFVALLGTALWVIVVGIILTARRPVEN